jgi:mRNA interferase MazF
MKPIKGNPPDRYALGEMNRHIHTVIVAPTTTAGKEYPLRIDCDFKEDKGYIVLDQIRTIEKNRLVKKLRALDSETQLKIISVL